MNKNYRIIKSWEREGEGSIIVSIGYDHGNLSLNTLKVGFHQRLIHAQPVDNNVVSSFVLPLPLPRTPK